MAQKCCHSPPTKKKKKIKISSFPKQLEKYTLISDPLLIKAIKKLHSKNQRINADAKKTLIFETRLFPDRVSDPAQIPALERPPDPFMHRQRRHSRPRQILVRGHSVISTFLLIFLVFVFVLLRTVAGACPVLAPQDFRPIRNAHRQRPRPHRSPVDVDGLPHRFPERARAGNGNGSSGFSLISGGIDAAAPDLAFVELELIGELRRA